MKYSEIVWNCEIASNSCQNQLPWNLQKSQLALMVALLFRLPPTAPTKHPCVLCSCPSGCTTQLSFRLSSAVQLTVTAVDTPLFGRTDRQRRPTTFEAGPHSSDIQRSQWLQRWKPPRYGILDMASHTSNDRTWVDWMGGLDVYWTSERFVHNVFKHFRH